MVQESQSSGLGDPSVASTGSLDLPDPEEPFSADLFTSEFTTSGVARLDDPLAPPPAPPSSDPTEFVKPKKEGLEKSSFEDYYILGTLVVRVVAAKNLEPVKQSGIGGMVRSTLGNSGGRANPYASVKYGNSTQRSSEVFDTLDPIWPRHETMYMDVSLPLNRVAHPQTQAPPGGESPPAGTATPPAEEYEKPPSTLTVALFHNPEFGGRGQRYPTKGATCSGDSDDLFLGMASLDLTKLFTGCINTIDTWLRLAGTETSRGAVRIVCEFESSEIPPRQGDYCRFTRFCHPRDLYPLEVGRQYRVAEVNGDVVLISYSTPEGWVCTFQAHRCMLTCEERHPNAAEIAQDEFASLAERFSHSPMVHSIAETTERVATEGLLSVGEEVVQGGLLLFNRWFSGGVDTVMGDLANATNWDGRYNPDNEGHIQEPEVDVDLSDSLGDDSVAPVEVPSYVDDDDKEGEVALPNMPCCPITGEPMIDPVVAADGHTYERSAIARWFSTSNKSPMTGAVLTHKELVTNYGLLSSVQEAAQVAAAASVAAKVTFVQSDVPLTARPVELPDRIEELDLGDGEEALTEVVISTRSRAQEEEIVFIHPSAFGEAAAAPAGGEVLEEGTLDQDQQEEAAVSGTD